MADKDKQEIELQVKESADGSAIVDLPDGIDMGDDLDDDFEPKQQAEGGSVEEDDDPDHPDDTEAMRAAKRAKRRSKKEMWKNTHRERELQIQQLKRQNEEMQRDLQQLKQIAKSTEMTQLDKHIDDESTRYEYAKMKLAEAAAAGDGESMVEAQEMMQDAREKLAHLSGVKNQQTARQQPAQARPDPRMQQQAAKWLQRNDWYKPDLSDTDSRIAQTIDKELVSEGWNPNDPDYWDELDNRLQKHLPHRYNVSAERNSSDRKPRNVVGSSGREASASYGGSNRTFTLTPQQVGAIKEAGMWDNIESRNRMIRRYAQQSRNMEGK